MPESKNVVALGFYGTRLKVHCGSMSGFEPFGPERKITRSENNILYELDGEPALELYKKYLGDRLQEAKSQLSEQHRDYLSRMGNAAHRMQALIDDLLQLS